jgi:ATP-binding cassette, subfamily C (CFTR/MRP), member 1
LADNLIFLGANGEITRQGSPETVSLKDGVLSLTDKPQAITARPKPELSEDVLHEIEMLENPEPGTNRHVGDLRVYSYYAKIGGWWTISVYLLACAAFVFGVTFPCKLSSTTDKSHY